MTLRTRLFGGAALVLAVAGCGASTPDRPHATGGNPSGSGLSSASASPGPSVPSSARPAASPLGTAIRYRADGLDLTASVRRTPGPPPADARGDQIWFDLTVGVTAGSWTFTPTLVEFVWADPLSSPGNPRVDAGPPPPHTLNAGAEQTWTLRFGAPAHTPDSTVDVHVRPGVLLGAWRT